MYAVAWVAGDKLATKGPQCPDKDLEFSTANARKEGPRAFCLSDCGSRD